MWTAEVRTLLPANAEPVEVFDHGMEELEPGALGVEIFVAQDERAQMRASSLIGDPERAGVAHVKQASR